MKFFKWEFEIPERLRSRKFFVTLISLIGIVMGLDPELVQQSMPIILAYLVSQGFVDAVKR